MRKTLLILPLLTVLTACTNKQPSPVVAPQPEIEPAAVMVNDPAHTNQTRSIPPEEVAQAALDGDLATIEQALSDGMAVDMRDDQGRTFLMYAAFNGHADMIEKLLENGADVDARDSAGSTALMFASSGPFPDTVRLLLGKGADVNLADNNEHWTALMWAGAEGQAEIVRILLEAGADPTLTEADGDTAESFALKNGHTEVVKILQEARTRE
jgi:ankyrin repeat protein